MNFIKHKNDGIIVQGEKITICKHMDSIQITARVSYEENSIPSKCSAQKQGTTHVWVRALS